MRAMVSASRLTRFRYRFPCFNPQHAGAVLRTGDVRVLQINARMEKRAPLSVLLSDDVLHAWPKRPRPLFRPKSNPCLGALSKNKFQVAREPGGLKNVFVPLGERSIEFRVQPAMHCEDCKCLSFAFGRRDSAVPAETMCLLEDSVFELHICFFFFFLDALVHICLLFHVL